jgi:hypothetical protein
MVEVVEIPALATYETAMLQLHSDMNDSTNGGSRGRYCWHCRRQHTIALSTQRGVIWSLKLS